MDWQPIATAPKRKYVFVWQGDQPRPQIARLEMHGTAPVWYTERAERVYPGAWSPIPKKPDFAKPPFMPQYLRNRILEDRRKKRRQKAEDTKFAEALKASGWSLEDERKAGNVGPP